MKPSDTKIHFIFVFILGPVLRWQEYMRPTMHLRPILLQPTFVDIAVRSSRIQRIGTLGPST